MQKKQTWPKPGDDGKFWSIEYWSPSDWISFGATVVMLFWLVKALAYWSLDASARWEMSIVSACVGILDLADGMLARSSLGGSLRGAQMDELTDKIKTSSALVVLVILVPENVNWMLAAILIARDAWVTIVRRRAVKLGTDEVKSARIPGKIKTVAIFIGISVAWLPDISSYVVDVIFCVAAILSIVSGLEIWARYKAAVNLREFVGEENWTDEHPLITRDGHGNQVLDRIGAPNWMGNYRLAIGPVAFAIYVWGLFGEASNAVALIMVALAATTDLLDGAIARRLGQVTSYGREFDPAADKSIQYFPLAGLIIIVLRSGILSELWTTTSLLLLGIILLRDLILLAIREVSKTKPKPSWFGKTRAGILAALVLLIGMVAAGWMPESTVVVIAVFITACSGMAISLVSIGWDGAMMWNDRQKTKGSAN